MSVLLPLGLEIGKKWFFKNVIINFVFPGSSLIGQVRQVCTLNLKRLQSVPLGFTQTQSDVSHVHKDNQFF